MEFPDFSNELLHLLSLYVHPNSYQKVSVYVEIIKDFIDECCIYLERIHNNIRFT